MRSSSPRRPVHGWVILDKPLGLTSTQALGRVRYLLGAAKAGHAGTLDPLATGLLPLAFGEATKLIPYVMDAPKTYTFTVRWGERRSTDDAEGEVLATSAARPSRSEVDAVLPRFLGTILQTPPAFSALKVAGKRAYALARAGAPPVLPPRPVTLDQLECLDIADRDTARFRVVCGQGTYVRSLARDLAEALGTQGFVAELRRTQVGPFREEEALSLEVLNDQAAAGTLPQALRPLVEGWNGLPFLDITEGEAQRLQQGQTVDLAGRIGHEPFDSSELNVRKDPAPPPLSPSSGIALARWAGNPVAVVRVVQNQVLVVRGLCV